MRITRMLENWKLCLNIFHAIKCIVKENGSYTTNNNNK